MFEYNFNLTETVAISVVLLILGAEIKKFVPILQKYYIPAPVIGGVIFSFITLIGYNTNTFAFNFEGDIRTLLLTAFFTTVGFFGSYKVLLSGGVKVALFLACASVLALLQNILGVSLAQLFGLHPLIGVAAGATSMTGGPGISAAFGPLLEESVKGAFTVALAASAFGLVAGGLVGGPVARRLMINKKLIGNAKDTISSNRDKGESTKKNEVTEKTLFNAFYTLILAIGIGVIVSYLLNLVITIPVYIGPMIIAAIIRSISDYREKELPMHEISILGNISLSVFLSMALMSIKLWELASLAIPLIAILFSQIVLTVTFAYFITFWVMGRDYDAAVMCAGHCGFALGSSPNAMANMATFTESNGPSPNAYLVVPIVGGLFIDFSLSLIITVFINIFK